MAVALVQGISNLSSTAGTTATATLPAAATAGNVLVAFIHTGSKSTGGAPTGWTQPAGGNANVNGRSSTIAYKVAAGGETGFSAAITSGVWEVHLLEYSGVDTTTPVQVAAASTGGVTTTAVTTTAGSNVHVVCSGGATTGPSATAWSGPTIGGAAATFVTVAPSTRLSSGSAGTAYGASYHLGVASAPTSISGTVTGVGSNISSGIVVLNVAAVTGTAYTYTVDDSAGVTGGQTLEVGRGVTDAAGSVDAAATAGVWLRQADDDAGLTGGQTLAVARTVTDAAGLADTATPSLTTGANYTATVTDAAGVADAQTLAVTRAVTDTAGAVDGTALAVARQVTDPAGTTDSPSRTGAWSRTVTDSAGLTDTAGTGTTTAAGPGLRLRGGSAMRLRGNAPLRGGGAAGAALTVTVTDLAGSTDLVAASTSGKVSSLTDTFATADPAKWSGIDGTNVLVTGGRLQVNATPSYFSAYSVHAYDLTGSQVSVEVPQVPNLGNGSTSAYLTAYDMVTGNSADLLWQGGTLYTSYTAGGVTSQTEIVFSPTAHRFWRIREAAGTLYWEATATGASWSQLRAVPTPWTMTAVTIFLKSGYWGTEPAPGFALFDNVNLPPTPAAPGAARTFYVDPAGSDTADGLGAGTAWATLAKVSAAPLFPGDRVLLKRGGVWTGGVTISDSGASGSPITLGAYGTGSLPIVDGGGASGVAGTSRTGELYGSWVVADGVEFRGSSDIGVLVFGTDCTVQGCAVRWGSYGVQQLPQAARAKILNNTMTDVNVGIIRPGTNDDGGGSGVLLEGDAAEVAFNVVTGCVFVSPDYGLDGQSIEVYGATNATIHHNRSIDSVAFTELGNPASSGNVYYDNVATSTLAVGGGFAVHGTYYDDGTTPDPFGPVTGTRAWHNTVVLTGGDAASTGVWVSPGGEIDWRNNVVVVAGSAKAASIGATSRTVTEAGNVYWNTGGAGSTVVGLPAAMSGTSTIADPLFVGGGDYRLRKGSPAIDRGATLAAVTTDYAGNPRTLGTAPDSGAYEGAVIVVTVTDSAGPVDTQAVTVGRQVNDAAGTVDTRALTVGRALTDLAGLTDLPLAGALTAARGVNESGAEYNVSPDGVWGTFPGTYGSQWFYDAPASIAYLASRGINSTRLPIAWERLQPVRGAALDTAERGRITSYLDTCHANGIRVIIVPASFCRYREGAYPTPGITVRLLGVDLTAADFVDLWTRMVAAFGAHPAVLGWELQGEPWGLPSTNLATTFGATFDDTLSGWTTQNCTLARTTTAPRTGAGALQMTVTQTTSGGTNAQVWFATGGATSLTFSVWVRSPAATGPAQFVIDWYDSSMTYLTSVGYGWVNNVSPAWQQSASTVTPPAGAWRGVLSLDAYGATAGDVFIWDDLTSNALAVQTGAQLWEATAQTLVTAIRGTGDTHMIYVPGHEWQAPTKWRANHPSPFVTDPAGKVTYSAHHYYDRDQNATFAYSYAQENADSIAAGYASITDRALSWLAQFTDWCQEFGVKGALTETGWPHNADTAAWNALADALYNRLDQLGMDVWVWMVGESYGATNQLSPYDTAGTGSTLSAANAQASIIEAHLGAGPGGAAMTVAVADSAGVADTWTLTVGRRVADSGGPVDTQSLATTRAVTDPGGAVDSMALAAGIQATDSAGMVDGQVLAAGKASTVDDPAGAVDGQILAASHASTVDDPAGMVDGQTLGVARTVTDAAGSTDTAAPASDWRRAVDDPAGAVDSTALTLERAQTDPAGSTDTASRVALASLAVTDTAGPTDATALLGAWVRVLTDDAGLTDAATTLGVPVGPAMRLRGGSGMRLRGNRPLRAGGASGFSAVVDDSAGSTDALAVAALSTQVVSDSAATSDLGMVTVGRQVDDPAGTVDAAGTVAVTVRAVTDDAGSTDTVVPAKSGSATYTVTDPAGAADSAQLLGQWLRQVDDPAGAVDAASPGLVYARQADDPAGAADSASLAVARQVTDDTGERDAAATAAASVQSVTDPAGVVDAAASGIGRVVDDPAGAIDTASPLRFALITVTDTSAATDTATPSQGFGVAVTDDTGQRDSTSTAAAYAQAFTDPAGAGDGQALTVARQADDNAGASDSASSLRFALIAVTDVAGATDTTAQAQTFGTVVADDTGTSDLASTTAAWARSLTDSAGLADAAAVGILGVQWTVAVTDTGGPTDTTTIARGYAAAVTDDAGQRDTLTILGVWLRTAADDAGLTDALTLEVGLPVTDPAGPTDAVTLTTFTGKQITYRDDLGRTPRVANGATARVSTGRTSGL